MTNPLDDAAGNALVILGLVWGDDGCSVRLRVPGGPSELVPMIGTELNYRVEPDGPRHCIGHHSPRKNKGQYVDCLNAPQPNERTCVSCAVADAEFASNLHHAHTRDRDALDRSVVDHLEQSNILYLAAFRDGSVKIGTSTATRKMKRLAEQGAWHAVEVATVTNGFVVRQLEDLITEKLEIPQSVAIKRKLHGMANPLSPDQLAAKIDPLVERVHEVISAADRLPGTPDLAADESDTVELSTDRWEFPDAGSSIWDGLHSYPARLDRGSHHLEVLQICGRLAVMARPGSADRFVADVGQLYGIQLDLGQYEPDQLAIQDSLF